MAESTKNVWSVVFVIVTALSSLVVWSTKQHTNSLQEWREQESKHLDAQIDFRLREIKAQESRARSEKIAVTQRETLMEELSIQRESMVAKQDTLNRIAIIAESNTRTLADRIAYENERERELRALRRWHIQVLFAHAERLKLDIPELPSALIPEEPPGIP